MEEKKLFRLVRTLEQDRAKLENASSLGEVGDVVYQNEVMKIERNLKALGLNPNLPDLIERAFYVEHGIDEMYRMLNIMGSRYADELIPQYMDNYGIKDISLTTSRLSIVASKIAKKEDDALPHMAARLTRLNGIEKWEILTDSQSREKWSLINAFMDRKIDPYSNPIRDVLVRNSANAVRRLLPMLEAGRSDERIRAIKELGAMGIIEADPRVLRYSLNPYEAELVLSSRDLYLIAWNPDWKKIAGDPYWSSQADRTPGRTKLGMRLEHEMVMDQNPDWEEIALNMTLALARHDELDTP